MNILINISVGSWWMGERNALCSMVNLHNDSCFRIPWIWELLQCSSWRSEFTCWRVFHKMNTSDSSGVCIVWWRWGIREDGMVLWEFAGSHASNFSNTFCCINHKDAVYMALQNFTSNFTRKWTEVKGKVLLQVIVKWKYNHQELN